MDPLSVAASIVGVLSAAAKVSSVLTDFIQNTKGASTQAQSLLTDVDALGIALGQLQSYLGGSASSSRSRVSMILVEQVIVTLTQCVTIFSELEEVLRSARTDGEISMLDRVKWAFKESKIDDIQKRLQSTKSSLTLMLTILQCRSTEEAQSATDRLSALVEQVLAQNHDLSLRLRCIDEGVVPPSETNTDDDSGSIASSSKTATLNGGMNLESGTIGHRNPHDFAFEEDLLASRVYNRPLLRNSTESLVTSAAWSTATSILSALSLTDVSNISILALPVYAHEISNSNLYTFGDFQSQAFLPQTVRHDASEGNKWIKVAASVRTQRPQRLLSNRIFHPRKLVIFGDKLENSPQYRFRYRDYRTGYSFYGSLPAIVAQTGKLLTKWGTTTENIFAVSGSQVRIRQLEDIFTQYPFYKRDEDWTGYTAHDIANILLKFLLQMPEPLIPQLPFERFHPSCEWLRLRQILKDLSAQTNRPVSKTSLRTHLLLYIIGLLAKICSKAEINKLTPQRAAAIFQPAIVGCITSRDPSIGEDELRRFRQDTVVHLIETCGSQRYGVFEIWTREFHSID